MDTTASALPPDFNVRLTYLIAIKNSTGSRQYRSLFLRQNGRSVDILDDGQRSCAYYVSCLLLPFRLIGAAHTTVDGALHDMLSSGWRNAKRSRIGSVLVWEPYEGRDGALHRHIGFHVGRDMAISNWDAFQVPTEHGYRFKNRSVEQILWHPALA